MIELRTGMTASRTKAFTVKDVQMFADLTGDYNRVHLDPEYAATTVFRRPIVHGKLVESLASAMIASRLPGPMSVFKHCSVEYKAPVFYDDPVECTITVLSQYTKPHWVHLGIECRVGPTMVIEGSAIVTLPKEEVRWLD